jgi:hypothetical protein
MTHVDDLLARGLEDGLRPEEEMQVREHLRSCARCSALADDLRANDLRLGAPQEYATLPPLVRHVGRAGRTGTLAFAGVLTTIALVVIVAITVSVLPGQPSASSPSPGPTGLGPYMVAAHRLVTGTVPGGGDVVTQAFDSFRLISASGVARDSVINGVALGTPAFDGVSRVAYWARTSLTSGAYRLTIWDATSQQERVILALGDEGIAGAPLWTADARALIVSTRAAAGDQVRLLRVDASGAATTVLSETPPTGAVAPIYADDSIVVGIQGGSLVVLDARTGQPLSTALLRESQPRDFTVSRSGVVLELVRAFEGASGPLRIWRVANPGAIVATIEERGITTPVYWGATSEVVYARGLNIYAFNLSAQATRVLATFSEAPSLVGFNTDGDRLIVRTGDRFRVLERKKVVVHSVLDVAELQVREDLGFVLNPSLFEPIGVGP